MCPTDRALSVIINLTFQHDESTVGISSVGGVEALVNVMETFPKCDELQWCGCLVLGNLALCNLGKKKAVKSCGLKGLLAAVNNHLSSATVSQKACSALCNIVRGSKENTGLLITLGGGAAVAKVRRKWPDNNDIQKRVRLLANCFASEWKACADEE